MIDMYRSLFVYSAETVKGGRPKDSKKTWLKSREGKIRTMTTVSS